VDKNIQKSEKSEKSAAVTAAAAAAALQLQQVTNAKRVADRHRISTAISEIRNTLKMKPKGLSGLKKMCLSLRDTVMTVSDLNTPKARYDSQFELLRKVFLGMYGWGGKCFLLFLFLLCRLDVIVE
jgi:hypothetical protein